MKCDMTPRDYRGLLAIIGDDSKDQHLLKLLHRCVSDYQKAMDEIEILRYWGKECIAEADEEIRKRTDLGIS